jgi:hypothetical protein
MKAKMGSTMAMLLMGAMLGGENISTVRAENVTGSLPDPPVPKGCKIYFFNENGYHSTEQMRKTEIVFKCTASNDANAVRKYNNWKSKQK